MILFDGGHIKETGTDINVVRRLGAGESLDLSLVCLGGGKASFDLDIAGEDVKVNLRGLYVCKGDDRLDISVNLRHIEGGSCSMQLFKGIAGGKAHVRFDGRIVVARDAQKTEAYQTSRNLVLSDDAVVQTLPQLEIYA